MRLDRVEGGDSRRTGPGRTTSQDVPSEGSSVVSVLGYTPVSYTIAPVHALPKKGFKRDRPQTPCSPSVHPQAPCARVGARPGQTSPAGRRLGRPRPKEAIGPNPGDPSRRAVTVLRDSDGAGRTRNRVVDGSGPTPGRARPHRSRAPPALPRLRAWHGPEPGVSKTHPRARPIHAPAPPPWRVQRWRRGGLPYGARLARLQLRPPPLRPPPGLPRLAPPRWESGAAPGRARPAPGEGPSPPGPDGLVRPGLDPPRISGAGAGRLRQKRAGRCGAGSGPGPPCL